ncbi:MAG: hypothetical protein ACI4F3_12280 [Enterocloster sp.]
MRKRIWAVLLTVCLRRAFWLTARSSALAQTAAGCLSGLMGNERVYLVQ